MTFMGTQVVSRTTAQLRRAARFVRNLVRRPVLRYVEVHLADHCNLNCKGCGHFCPIASERFVDLEQFSADLYRLSQLFRKIETIRLMGGEPLLHPGVTEALVVSRKFLPCTDIRLVTNGILLPKMGERFWRACKDNGVTIDLTKYPVSLDVAKIQRLAAERGVRIDVYECNQFIAAHNLKGDSNPRAAMNKCRAILYCPFLQEGMLYPCGLPALVHYFNKRFNTAIPADGAINIHDGRMTGRRILSLLDRPVPACRYCTAGEYVTFDWAVSRREISEWVAQ